ncbi:MAG: nuclear transport factor 2 family protein [Tatlockia sp.]|jgi:hypothetical protein
MINPLDHNPAEKLLIAFCKGYHNRNLPFILELFTQQTNVWGSGVDEYRVGHAELSEQLKRDWSQSEAGQIKIVRFVDSPKNSNWAAAICQAHIIIEGQEHVFNDLRGTVTVEKENDIWKIAHMHASFPDYRNPVDGSFPDSKFAN